MKTKHTLKFNNKIINNQQNDSDRSNLTQNNQKQKNLVKSKLISSLQQSLQHLMTCLMNKTVSAQLLAAIKQKRQRDKIEDLYLIKIDQNKQQYSSFLYFKINNELLRFPESIREQIVQSIAKFYNKMQLQSKINVITLSQFIRYKINVEIDKIIQPLTKLQNSQNQHQYSYNSLENQAFLSKNISKLYNILQIDQPQLINVCQAQQNSHYFYYLQDQYQRNQKMLKSMIKFSTKIKKYCNIKQYRLFYRSDIMEIYGNHKNNNNHSNSNNNGNSNNNYGNIDRKKSIIRRRNNSFYVHSNVNDNYNIVINNNNSNNLNLGVINHNNTNYNKQNTNISSRKNINSNSSSSNIKQFKIKKSQSYSNTKQNNKQNNKSKSSSKFKLKSISSSQQQQQLYEKQQNLNIQTIKISLQQKPSMNRINLKPLLMNVNKNMNKIRLKL